MKVAEVEKNFGVVDLVIFVALLASSAATGVYFAYRDRRNNSTDNYHFADRKMSPYAVAMSMSVSYVSAITVIGYPVEVYVHGLALAWMIPALIIAAVLGVIYYVPLLYRLQLRTIYEYLEMRYGTAVRRLCSGVVTAQGLTYMGITVYLPALTLDAVTPIQLNWSIALTSLICTFYTSVGGMKAVIWTDVMQGTLMVLGLLMMFIKTTGDVGGFGNVVAAVDRGQRNNFFTFTSDPRVRTSPLAWFLGAFVANCIGSCCTQVFTQRYLSCKSEREAKIAGILRVIPTSLFTLLAAANGLAMYAYYEGCDPTSANLIKKVDQTTPRMAVEIFHDMPGMAGLFVSAAYSGTLSTVSSGINSLSAMALEDFIKPRWPIMRDSTANRISKALSFLLGLLVMSVAYIVSLFDGTIIQIALVATGILSGPILSLFTMGVFVPWTNKWGAFLGLITGWIMTLWIALSAIIHGAAPEFRETLHLSTDLCNFTLSDSSMEIYSGNGSFDFTAESNVTMAAVHRPPLADTLYSLSPFLYGVWGFLCGCIAMFVLSLVTGPNRASEMDPRLFVPLIGNKKIFPERVIKFFRLGVPELRQQADEKPKPITYDNAVDNLLLSVKN